MYRDLLLGSHGSEESQREYERVINEWLASGRNAPSKPLGPASDLTVAELCLRFWNHAEGFYRLADGSPSKELDHYKYAQKALVALYGHKPASGFGPLGLKAVRQAMIEVRQIRVRFKGERPDGFGSLPIEFGLTPMTSSRVRRVGETPGSPSRFLRHVRP